MSEAVSDIIVARARQGDQLKPMLAWSTAAHILVLAGALTMTSFPTEEAPRIVMTVSLGGAPGPPTGGMTQMGGRTIQQPRPPEPVRRPETPPAAKTPAMSLPDPKARPRQRSTSQAPAQASGRTPTTGDQPQQGSARSDTQVRGQGFGLSSAGGGGDGVQLNVANFCCPEYLAQMRDLIQRNWRSDQGVVGNTVVIFTIQRDGRIEGARVFQTSGFFVLDDAAHRAVLATRQLPPLPAAFSNPSLEVRLTFTYQR